MTLGHKMGPPSGHLFCRGPSRENMKKKTSCLKPQGLEPLYLVCKQVFCVVGGCRVLLSAQRLYYMYGRDQLDCSPTNGLNHYLPLIKTGAHSTGERFRATTISPSAGMMFEWALVLYDAEPVTSFNSNSRYFKHSCL